MYVVSGVPPNGGSGGPLDDLTVDLLGSPATHAQTAAVLEFLMRELAEGALGMGVLLGHAPRTETKEPPSPHRTRQSSPAQAWNQVACW